jgi:hypothetical protein
MSSEDEEYPVSHVTFEMHDFWPHNPDIWFRQLESKFRICNITSSTTKFDLTLVALPAEVCSNISDGLGDIDEFADDAYDQLKTLLITRYTKDRWTRTFELLNLPDLDLLPTDDKPCTLFMAMFLLRLPSEMRAHLIGQDFKDCNLMAECADRLHSRRANANSDNGTAINTGVAGLRRRDFSPRDRRRRSPSRQRRSRQRTPGPQQNKSDTCFYHTAFGDKAKKCKPGCAWP